MKLEAVMENLQRAQAARLAEDERLRRAAKERDIRSSVDAKERGVQERAGTLARVPTWFRAGVSSQPPDSLNGTCRAERDRSQNADMEDEEDEDGEEEEDFFKQSLMKEAGRSASVMTGRIPPNSVFSRQTESPCGPQNHEWTFEEQFKQLYELDEDEKRKEFLDDLFSFMQKRGTPVNRIPIMAKQVLDLYALYQLVTDKGGLVEVINKKIWREITKGLHLPTSITSAAFTLRTQYMKYLYPYECDKRGLSSPGELQAAIDSNRREGRRQSYGAAILNFPPVDTPTLLSSNVQLSRLPNNNMPHIMKKGDSAASRTLQAESPADHGASCGALLHLREPPEKKMMTEEQRTLVMQHALQHNLLAVATQVPLSIQVDNRDDGQERALNLSTSGISSINMSIEINGLVYTGVLFAGQSSIAGMTGHGGKTHSDCPTQAKSSPVHFHPSCSSSSSSSSSVHEHRISVSSP
ncbi:AT-rich interactive domain-containing protein 3A [Entelurus aequoreus]|uniref:AT-rich interactive domain-containing protein 3A n=1 Tax=Entelurus aequoreus TaxID=161455 RepID=UPI002B1DED3F|nr:AT-rich interactive domain-containing protein 3A [Entelurus aequoreus]